MLWYVIKLFLTAGIIVIISEISKKLPLLGSLIASLPLISVLGILWMYGETKDIDKIASHAFGTFWYVIPSLPMFLTLPYMLKKGFSFSLSMSAGIILTIVLYILMTKGLARFGINI